MDRVGQGKGIGTHNEQKLRRSLPQQADDLMPEALHNASIWSDLVSALVSEAAPEAGESLPIDEVVADALLYTPPEPAKRKAMPQPQPASKRGKSLSVAIAAPSVGHDDLVPSSDIGSAVEVAVDKSLRLEDSVGALSSASVAPTAILALEAPTTLPHEELAVHMPASASGSGLGASSSSAAIAAFAPASPPFDSQSRHVEGVAGSQGRLGTSSIVDGFFKTLGLSSVEAARSAKSHCFHCHMAIEKLSPRFSIQWSRCKPHSWLHTRCVPLITTFSREKLRTDAKLIFDRLNVDDPMYVVVRDTLDLLAG